MMGLMKSVSSVEMELVLYLLINNVMGTKIAKMVQMKSVSSVKMVMESYLLTNNVIGA